MDAENPAEKNSVPSHSSLNKSEHDSTLAGFFNFPVWFL
jgi:hypothetical protein